MRQSYDRMFASKAGREQGDQFDLGGDDADDKEAVLPQILGPDRFAPEFKTTLLTANVRHIADQLLGKEASGGGAHAILKPAHHGAVTPWHQDIAYWNPGYEYDGRINVWIPLQDVNEDNGCMHFVPGSHKLDVLHHQSIGNNPRVHGLEVKPSAEFDKLLEKAVACPIAAGCATMHLPRTLHYAGPNRTDAPRRAYIMAYVLPPVLLEKPRQFPWLDEKQTARAERRKQAEAAGTLKP